jgi:CRISPR-associated protein Csb2
MPTLQLSFPGGRYHATPHGFHVNEGHIEWPPSPWRLLRAFVAVGFTKLLWSEVPDTARRLLDKLASSPPMYHLPPAATAHSRHYMPIGGLDKGREKTSLVFDTWADVADGVLQVQWDCPLADDESAVFSDLVAGLGYLGRSESWVVGEVIDSVPANLFNAVPHSNGSHRGRDWEQVTVLGTITPTQYVEWRTVEVNRILEQFPLPEGRKKPPQKLLKDREKSVEPYPIDLIDCLMKDTAWWKSHGWNGPPGSQTLLYWRRRDLLQVGPPTTTRRHEPPRVSAMLLALTTPSGSKSALPACTRTLPQAELFHRALIGLAAAGENICCPELTGLDEMGRPLQSGHSHAHVLPLDLDRDNHIDHVLIHAPMGLGSLAQNAIRKLRRTWTKGGVGELQLALAGIGNLEEFRLTQPPYKLAVDALLGGTQGAAVWISQTPYIPPRFLKQHGKNTLEGQVRSELSSRGIATDCEITVLADESRRFRHYIRSRKRGATPPPQDLGLALRIQFANPVTGPISLGYAAHFGMGQFVALASQ